MFSRNLQAATLCQIFSTAEKSHVAQASSSHRPVIHNIGRGTCGTVFGIGNIGKAIKLGTDQDALQRDYEQTSKAWQCLQTLEQSLRKHFHDHGLLVTIPNIPRCFEFYSNCSETIHHYEGTLPGGSSSEEIGDDEREKPGYTMQKIPPIPTAARIALVKEIFEEDAQDEFLNNPENDDCLLRLYFGKEVDDERFEDLRNFPLHDDQMVEIGLDTSILVSEVAIGLAIVHWGARLDGMDVEFVLSARLDSTSRSTIAEPISKPRRSTHVWVLDFDKASPISIDEDPDILIRNLVVATSGNDPYFPRLSINKERWNQFSWAYIETGKRILQMEAQLDEDLLNLPALFISALEKQFEEEDESEEETMIRFEPEDDINEEESEESDEESDEESEEESEEYAVL